MSTAAATKTATAVTLPLEHLLLSNTNPRKHRDDKEQAELVASIQQHGILTPLLVRPAPADRGAAHGLRTAGGYVIVAGSRRYHAAKSLKLKEVPVQIREMTDELALELQVIENLQRAGIHPLDEAEGFRVFERELKMTAKNIAEKVSKSESYVLRRMKLADLISDAKKVCYDGKLSLEHAMLFSRLTAADQETTLRWILHQARHRDHVTVAELREHIEEELMLELSEAPFSKTDATLFAKAGSCVDCPKRTGANKLLFADVQGKDRCTDAACFQTKVNAHVSRIIEGHEAKKTPLVLLTGKQSYEKDRLAQGYKGWPVLHDGQFRTAAAKSCPNVKMGIVVEGGWRHKAGEQFHVCAESKCKVHAHSSSGGSSYGRSPAEKARIKKQALVKVQRGATLHAVMEKVKDLNEADYRLLADDAWESMSFDEQREFLFHVGWLTVRKGSGKLDLRKIGRNKIRELPLAEVPRFLMRSALFGHVDRTHYYSSDPGDKLKLTAKRYKVNAGAIARKVSAELAAKRKPAPKAKRIVEGS